MNKKVKVEYTQVRVNNGGDAERKAVLSATVKIADNGKIEQISDGSISLLDGRYIGGFGEPNGGFSLNINSGYEGDTAEVFEAVQSFLADIKEEGGEA